MVRQQKDKVAYAYRWFLRTLACDEESGTDKHYNEVIKYLKALLNPKGHNIRTKCWKYYEQNWLPHCKQRFKKEIAINAIPQEKDFVWQSILNQEAHTLQYYIEQTIEDAGYGLEGTKAIKLIQRRGYGTNI